MILSSRDVPDLLHRSTTRVIFGAGALMRVGAAAKEEGARRVLLVSDRGVERAGHVRRAEDALRTAGLEVVRFLDTAENPTTEHVAAGVEAARRHDVDFLIGLGGGSAMDCMKGINLILTNGGRVADYWGENKATEPLLPSIAVPTTAGTGSEAQSFALIRDPVTHRKMACGDRRAPGGLRPRVALLDPDLTATQPPSVAAAVGIDAAAHAIETAGTTRRSDTSLAFSAEAWRRVRSAYPKVIRDPRDATARADMLIGAHLAGAAIEHSMLGAAHACANPLTARYGVVHGQAVGLMLPHVARHNCADGANPYAALDDDPDRLLRVLHELLATGRLPRTLRDVNVPRDDLSELARLAAQEWTAGFNPRPVDAQALLEIYHAAWTSD